MFVVSVFSGSFENNIIPFLSEIRAKEEKLTDFFSSVVSGTIILTLLTFVLYNLFFSFYYFSFKPFPSNILTYNFLLSFLIPLSIIVSLFVGYLNANKNFNYTALQNSFRSLIVIIFILLFSNSIGFLSVVLGYIVGESIRVGITILKVLNYIKIHLTFKNIKSIFPFFKISGFQSAAIVVWSINPIVDMIMASKLGIGSISKLQYAYKLIMIPNVLISLGVITVLFSYYSDLYYKEGLSKLKEKAKKNLVFSLPLLILTIFLLFLFGDFILRIAYGHNKQFNYLELKNIYYFYLPLILLNIIGLFFVRLLQILKKTDAILIASVISFILNIVFNLIFIKLLGLKGLALSTTLVMLFQVIFVTIYFFMKKEKTFYV